MSKLDEAIEAMKEYISTKDMYGEWLRQNAPALMRRVDNLLEAYDAYRTRRAKQDEALRRLKECADTYQREVQQKTNQGMWLLQALDAYLDTLEKTE